MGLNHGETEFRTERGFPNIYIMIDYGGEIHGNKLHIKQPKQSRSREYDRVVVPRKDVEGFLRSVANKSGIKIKIL